MIRANCRERFTGADFDFIVRTLARSPNESVSLVDLLSDGETRDAVLDNPRNTPRMADPATFEPRDALARWIETDGLPFAIVDDVRGFSAALFTSTDTLAEFGPSRVIKRHGRAICNAQQP